MVACRAFVLLADFNSWVSWGKKKMPTTSPFRSLIGAGVIISMNADAPSTYPDWRAGVQAAAATSFQVGQGSWTQPKGNRAEAIGPTRGRRLAGPHGIVKGSVEVNKLADLCVMSDDILTIDENKIKEYKSHNDYSWRQACL